MSVMEKLSRLSQVALEIATEDQRQIRLEPASVSGVCLLVGKKVASTDL